MFAPLNMLISRFGAKFRLEVLVRLRFWDPIPFFCLIFELN